MLACELRKGHLLPTATSESQVITTSQVNLEAVYLLCFPRRRLRVSTTTASTRATTGHQREADGAAHSAVGPAQTELLAEEADEDKSGCGYCFRCELDDAFRTDCVHDYEDDSEEQSEEKCNDSEDDSDDNSEESFECDSDDYSAEETPEQYFQDNVEGLFEDESEAETPSTWNNNHNTKPSHDFTLPGGVRLQLAEAVFQLSMMFWTY